MIVRKGPLAHEAVGNRDVQVFDKLPQLGGGIGQQDTATGIDDRFLGTHELTNDLCGGFFINRGFAKCPGVVFHPLEKRHRHFFRKYVHGHIDQDGSGLAAFRQLESFFNDLRE